MKYDGDMLETHIFYGLPTFCGIVAWPIIRD